jgi:hypothetical protein
MKGPNKPPGANSRHVSRGRSGNFGVAAVAQAERWAAAFHIMLRLARLSSGVFVAILLLSGCAHTPRMAQAEVVRAAGQAGEAAGYRLADYKEPEVHFEFTEKDRSWSVFYKGRAAEPGNHFLVVIDDKTAATRVAPGR